jgi:excisionase family DNA binding protein
MDFILTELKEIKELLKKQIVQQKEILTIEEAVDFLGLSKSRLYKMTSNKEIPHYKPGGKVTYLKRTDLEEWVFSNRIGSVEELYNDSYKHLDGTNKNIKS